MKKRGLGRSLNAILSTNTAVLEPESANAPAEKAALGQALESIQALPLAKLQRGKYQPRREMDQSALDDLASSIQSQGVLQPVIVRQLAASKFEIIAGERRCRAAKLAGLAEIPAIVRDITDETAMAVGLIENIQRENLNAIEEAMAMQRLLQEFSLTHQEVAESVGRSRTAVSNLLRLLNLSEPVRRLLEHGDLEMGHARALLALPESDQLLAANYIVDRGLSVRDTEHYVRSVLKGPAAEKVGKPVDPDVTRLQKRLSDQLQVKVDIKHQSSGRGKVFITYKNLSELEAILDRME
jgi:ParB family chromosome partitioning protein